MVGPTAWTKSGQVLAASLSPYRPTISRKSLETDEFSPQIEKGFKIMFAASVLIIKARRKIGRDAPITLVGQYPSLSVSEQMLMPHLIGIRPQL